MHTHIMPRLFKKIVATLTLCLFVWWQFATAQTFVWIGGDIDFTISEITTSAVDGEVFLNEKPSVTITIQNIGDGDADTLGSPLPTGTIICERRPTVGDPVLLYDPVIDQWMRIETSSQIPFTAELSNAFSQEAGEKLIRCEINRNREFAESDFTNNSIDVTLTVVDTPPGRFDIALDKSTKSIEQKIDTAIPLIGADGINEFIVRTLTNIIIPLVIIGWIILALIGFFQLMTSESSEESAKATNYITRWVAWIVIMTAAYFISSTIFEDILDFGLVTEFEWVLFSRDIYERIAFPFLKLLFFLLIGVLFVMLLIRVFSFLWSSSEDNIKASRTIIVRNIVGILVIIGAKELIEAAFGTQQQVINELATSTSEIGSAFFENKNIPILYEVINRVLWLTAFIIMIIIIVQTFRLLTQPEKEENITSIRKSILYMLAWILIIGAGYLVTNFLIIT